MIEIVISIIALLIIFVLSIYFYFDIKKHKDENETDFISINNNITEEKENRLANLKYVVDQVNITNKNMDSEYNSNLSDLQNKQESFEKDINSLMKPKNATTGTPVPFSSLNTSPSPNISLELINHVSSVGGMTIKDLHGGVGGLSKSLMACGTGIDSSKCIKFPDENGDTYLTSIVAGKSIVAGAPLMTKDISIDGSLSFKNGETSLMEISPAKNIITDTDINTARIKTNGDINLDLMSNNFTNITGNKTLNLLSDPLTGKIIMTANTADATAVSDFKLPKKVSITKNSQTSPISATIELNENDDLVITPPVGKKIIFQGNLDVSGNISSTNGNIVTMAGNIYSKNNINAENNIYANTGVVQAKIGKVLGTNIIA